VSFTKSLAPQIKKARGDGAPQGATSLSPRSAWPCEGHVPEARTALRRSIDVAGQCRNFTRNARTCTRRRTARCHPLRRSFQAEDPRRLGTGCGHWRQSQGRRIVGAFAPRSPFRPTPQAASPRSGSGRVNLSLPGGRVRHEPRGRRASLRSQERLRTAPLTNEAIGIYTHVLICQHLANASF